MRLSHASLNKRRYNMRLKRLAKNFQRGSRRYTLDMNGMQDANSHEFGDDMRKERAEAAGHWPGDEIWNDIYHDFVDALVKLGYHYNDDTDVLTPPVTA